MSAAMFSHWYMLLGVAPAVSAFKYFQELSPQEHDGKERCPPAMMASDEEEELAEVEWPCETTPAAELPGRCRGTVWWLHVPKTGTSFTASAERCRCTTGWEPNHAPLPQNASDALLSTVVAMFREPRERLMSVYMYIRIPKYRCGLGQRGCSRDWGWDEPTETATKYEILAEKPPSEVLSRFRGCYTNMITGNRGCMSGELPREDEVLEAERRVSLFRFVGLTDQWLLSVCLFNFKLEGRRFVTDRQMQNYRPTQGHNRTRWDTSVLADDPVDGPIYEAAARRFWHEVRLYNITEERCPMEHWAGWKP